MEGAKHTGTKRTSYGERMSKRTALRQHSSMPSYPPCPLTLTSKNTEDNLDGVGQQMYAQVEVGTGPSCPLTTVVLRHVHTDTDDELEGASVGGYQTTPRQLNFQRCMDNEDLFDGTCERMSARLKVRQIAVETQRYSQSLSDEIDRICEEAIALSYRKKVNSTFYGVKLPLVHEVNHLKFSLELSRVRQEKALLKDQLAVRDRQLAWARAEVSELSGSVMSLQRSCGEQTKEMAKLKARNGQLEKLKTPSAEFGKEGSERKHVMDEQAQNYAPRQAKVKELEMSAANVRKERSSTANTHQAKTNKVENVLEKTNTQHNRHTIKLRSKTNEPETDTQTKDKSDAPPKTNFNSDKQAKTELELAELHTKYATLKQTSKQQENKLARLKNQNTALESSVQTKTDNLENVKTTLAKLQKEMTSQKQASQQQSKDKARVKAANKKIGETVDNLSTLLEAKTEKLNNVIRLLDARIEGK